MRVLLTGASSYLGAEIARELHARGDVVKVLQRNPSEVAANLNLTEHLADITDLTAVAKAMTGVDRVIHLAAKVGVVGSYSEFHHTNVVGTQVVVTAAREASVAGLVYISSPSVAHTGACLVGVRATPAKPGQAEGHYARTKAIAEQFVLGSSTPEFPTVAIRPHLVWGPGDTQLVGRVLSRAKARRLVLVGGGRALVDTTYITNAVDATIAATDRVGPINAEAFIVSNGQPRTVAELFTTICEAAGVPGPTRSIPRSLAYAGGAVSELAWKVTGRLDDPPMTRFLATQLGTAHWFDLANTREKLQWEPRVSLATGFERLARTYC